MDISPESLSGARRAVGVLQVMNRPAEPPDEPVLTELARPLATDRLEVDHRTVRGPSHPRGSVGRRVGAHEVLRLSQERFRLLERFGEGLEPDELGQLGEKRGAGVPVDYPDVEDLGELADGADDFAVRPE